VQTTADTTAPDETAGADPSGAARPAGRPRGDGSGGPDAGADPTVPLLAADHEEDSDDGHREVADGDGEVTPDHAPAAGADEAPEAPAGPRAPDPAEDQPESLPTELDKPPPTLEELAPQIRQEFFELSLLAAGALEKHRVLGEKFEQAWPLCRGRGKWKAFLASCGLAGRERFVRECRQVAREWATIEEAMRHGGAAFKLSAARALFSKRASDGRTDSPNGRAADGEPATAELAPPTPRENTGGDEIVAAGAVPPPPFEPPAAGDDDPTAPAEPPPDSHPLDVDEEDPAAPIDLGAGRNGPQKPPGEPNDRAPTDRPAPVSGQTDPDDVPDGGAPDSDTPLKSSAVARFLTSAETMRECFAEACLEIRGRIDAATRDSLNEYLTLMGAWVYSLERALNRLGDSGPADD
jgi:hypothetical protein